MDEAAVQYAKKYLEDLLSFFGLNIDIYATVVEDDVIELHVPSTHLNGFLIGQHGDTLHSLQFVVSSALRNNGFEAARVVIDVADYKKQRAEHVAEQAEEWVAKVKETGQPLDLHPMGSADRRVVHKVANDAGLQTESVGFGRDRHVVLKPGEDQPVPEEEPEADNSDSDAV